MIVLGREHSVCRGDAAYQELINSHPRLLQIASKINHIKRRCIKIESQENISSFNLFITKLKPLSAENILIALKSVLIVHSIDFHNH